MTRVRIATPADNAFALDLMAHVPMTGTLVLSTRRDPDFFGLYDMQGGTSRLYTYDGSFQGMAGVVLRDGYLDGVAQRVGYLGDLRIRGNSRERVRFPALYGIKLAELIAETGCRTFYTGILADNALALSSLTRRNERRAQQPFYSLICPYQMASVQVLWPPRAPRIDGVDVRTATDDDVPRLAQFLHADHKDRAFGYRFDDGELQHRLAHWPGFSLEQTFIALDGNGDIIGCATAWDPTPVKRYRVTHYGGAMRAVRMGMRVASAVLGCPPLPREGEDFRTLYLCNLSVKRDDPQVLRGLLHAIYPLAWRQRAHFIALPLWGAADPHDQALHAFVVQRLRFQLFGVTAHDAARTQWPAARPGFEIALA